MGRTFEMVISPFLVFHHLLDQLLCLTHLQREECSSGGSIKVLMGLHSEPMVEVLDEQPILHSVVRSCLDVLLESLPCLQNGFSGLLLKVRNFATKKICFSDGKELDEEVVRTLLPHI